MGLEVITHLLFSKKLSIKFRVIPLPFIWLKKRSRNNAEKEFSKWLKKQLGVSPNRIELFRIALIHKSATVGSI